MLVGFLELSFGFGPGGVEEEEFRRREEDEREGKGRGKYQLTRFYTCWGSREARGSVVGVWEA